ncbi:nudC domain-containing protein 1 [Anopheles bellator]|uniref:nudC domain-containing protein 1 n=1 Tax=Anopheles bellator TaxID=139047 RepID=UPI002647ED31|nr:nudC domain-containing protein 1 [Anopheles bellator]XP_058064406.1 nudC domain-containing protein 1 [Anopheles bellator]
MRQIELRPDRKLLKSNFEGYKVSLDTIPVFRTELPTTRQARRTHPNKHQYSYHHARLFGLHNHLVRDPWNSGQCYFVDVAGFVQRVQYEPKCGRIKPISHVYKVSFRPTEDVSGGTAGSYNCSLVFISERIGLLADGQGMIHVLDTGDRSTWSEWKAKSVLPEQSDNETSHLPVGGSILLDAQLAYADNSQRRIHAIALQVQQNSEHSFEPVLHWFRLDQRQEGSVKPSQGTTEWEPTVSCVLRGGGFPRYCTLDYQGAGLLVASDKSFHFTYDSTNPLVTIDPVTPDANHTQQETVEPEQCPFNWNQTIDDVNVHFIKRDGVQFEVVRNPSFYVTANAQAVLDVSKFFGQIDSSATTWTSDQRGLQITFRKTLTGVIWPSLFAASPEENVPESESGPDGLVQTSRDSPFDNIAPNLNTPLEECDFGEAGGEEQYFTLERIARETNRVTNRVSLGTGPPLFSVRMRPAAPEALVLRYDVDALLWQPQPPPIAGWTMEGDEWNLLHEGTLQAFGYVQASKRRQKYLACAPDLRYAAICESERLLFIYRGSHHGGSGLRQRNGPQVSLGQQHLVSLDDGSEIIGICCENEAILLLTEKSLFTVQLEIEE